ncbi:FkbM family methyltransferase [Mucilaginibacter terrae]|nr:FkbM family methyltransferase [Mucilaginibacter terrae]
MKIKNLFKKNNAPTDLKQVKVGQYTLWANAQHPIQSYLETHKYYSRNLPRLAKYIEEKYSSYSIIDVGSNIGDSVALIRSADVKQPIFCFEGEHEYYKLLQTNLQQFNNVTAYEAFLGENNETKSGATEVSDGTAKLNLKAGSEIEVKSLTDLAIANNINNIKLLKIDTDGFDFKILRGAITLIEKNKTILFFEYDAAYLEEQGENGVTMFKILNKSGYNKLLFYDNFGKLLINLTTIDTDQITLLYNYMRKKEGAFPYYDVIAFHCEDDDLADKVIAAEVDFFK